MFQCLVRSSFLATERESLVTACWKKCEGANQDDDDDDDDEEEEEELLDVTEFYETWS